MPIFYVPNESNFTRMLVRKLTMTRQCYKTCPQSYFLFETTLKLTLKSSDVYTLSILWITDWLFLRPIKITSLQVLEFWIKFCLNFWEERTLFYLWLVNVPSPRFVLRSTFSRELAFPFLLFRAQYLISFLSFGVFGGSYKWVLRSNTDDGRR